MTAKLKAAAKKRKPSLARMRPKILRIAAHYGATNIRVFGSFARGEQRQRSDIDLLVDLPDGMSLFDLSGLKISLEEELHRRVDVLTDAGISRYLRKRILSEARSI